MKKNSIFWISYSDLMTSLFFVMLVLFVLAIGYLKIKINENERLIAELQAKQESLIKETERLKQLLNLEELFKPLMDDGYFYYLSECKKFIVKDFMGIEIFDPNKPFITNQSYKDQTIQAGEKIEDFLKILMQQNPELSYLLVIEGNMANDADNPRDSDRLDHYKVSYQRALYVYNLWLENDINFRNYNVEVMICGSGLNGLCRDENEENNKRFSIQIIPKISKPVYLEK